MECLNCEQVYPDHTSECPEPDYKCGGCNWEAYDEGLKQVDAVAGALGLGTGEQFVMCPSCFVEFLSELAREGKLQHVVA